MNRAIFKAAMLAMLCMGPPISPAQTYTGQELLNLCGGPVAGGETSEGCRAYFADMLQRMDGRVWQGRLAACPPASFRAPEAVALYKSESRVFPEALHVPAERLIQGMLLKFFPCTGT